MSGAGAPIGIFDSGVGGLTVARAVLDLLPNESLVYYADTARFPYGTKSMAEVHSAALEICDYLAAQGCKLIVVACNSASSALATLGRPKLGVPLLDVIEPPAQTAVRITRNRRIGVIGTQVTVDSGQYAEALKTWATQQVHVVSQACPEFVEIAERGETYGSHVMDVAGAYLEPLRDAGVDTLILGCTHYPLLSGPIGYVMGPEVYLVSSAEETAKHVYTVLRANDLLRCDAEPPSLAAYATADADDFARRGRRFLAELGAVKTP